MAAMTRRAFVLLFLVSWLAICSCRRYRSRHRIQVRLQGGTQAYAGRVQVFYKGIWGGICDNEWSYENAQVVCRQLGYKGVVLFTKRMFYGRQTGRTWRDKRIWMDRVKCGGRERNLGLCYHKGWGRVRCNRERLAGVMCDPGVKALTKQPPLAKNTQDLDIKLFKIKLESQQTEVIVTEGILTVKYGEDKWGVVCSDGWDMKDARVACGQLGFTHAVESSPDGTSWQASWKNVYILSTLQCTGSEASLLSCDSSGLKYGQHCESGLAVNLKCKTQTPPFKHARLKGGVTHTEGRAEVRLKDFWGTLCDQNIDINTANVICRTLGYGTAYEYTLGTVFPHGFDKVIYRQIKCTGQEIFLQNCDWKRAYRRDYPCKHYSDVGVRCNVPQKKEMEGRTTGRIEGGRREAKMAAANQSSYVEQVRLGGGSRYYLGRVEVKINGEWGMICGDGWTMKNAMVVCRQLGLGYASSNYSHAQFKRNGRTLMSGTTCFGHESSLDECLRHSLNNVSCSRLGSAAGVRCWKGAPDLVLDLKALERMRIDYITLGALHCSYEENCLASTATKLWTYDRWRYQRRLLRFSAKVHNVGTIPYRPIKTKEQWQWHTCHRHYHSEEEFALYDLIDGNHQKVAEGHKASFCLEDTVCDLGAKKFFNCSNGGDQGISVNCHDNYDYTLDCQWVDVTDLDYTPSRTYSFRVIVNPSFKVAESDYSNNVALCKITDYGSYVRVWKCILETCESGARSHHGVGNFACCKFPFVYKGVLRNTCLEDEKTGQFWCSTTSNYDEGKLWGYC